MATIRLTDIRGEVFRPGGVKLDGPTFVTKGTPTNYRISNYDSFSTYVAIVDKGNASVSEDIITINQSAAETAEQITLSVYKDGIPRTVAIPLTDGRVVLMPSIASPVNGTVGLASPLTFQGSTFISSPAGTLTHTATEWQISQNSTFTQLLINASVTTGDLTKYVATLPLGETLYCRVRYISNSTISPWSPTSTIDTKVYINTPVISGETTNVMETPMFTSSAFVTKPVNSDTHISTTWSLRRESDNVSVYQLDNSTTNKTSLTIPAGILVVGTGYTLQTQYNGNMTKSELSNKFNFTTASEFMPTVPGTPFGGGYYVGRYQIGGKIYALIVAPRSNGELAATNLLDSGTNISGPYSLTDGATNTTFFKNSGRSPAADWVKSLNIGGYRDWFIPAVNELELCYRYLKPSTTANFVNSTIGPNGAVGYNPVSIPLGAAYTSSSPARTTSSAFISGGSQAFTPAPVGSNDSYYFYLTSTQVNDVLVWSQNFNTGIQTGAANNSSTGATYRVRAVRKILIS